MKYELTIFADDASDEDEISILAMHLLARKMHCYLEGISIDICNFLGRKESIDAEAEKFLRKICVDVHQIINPDGL